MVLISPTPFPRGRSGPAGFPSPRWLSLPANSGPASDDALVILRSVLFRYVVPLGQTLTLRAAFTSSTYLLPQIPGPGRSSDDDLLNSRIIQTDFFRGHPLSKGAIRACGLSIAAWPSLPASSGPASEDALVALRSEFFACLVLKKVYHCRVHDATCKSLIINALSVFRVGVFTTLKTVKQLSLSNLQVALRPSIEGQR